MAPVHWGQTGCGRQFFRRLGHAQLAADSSAAWCARRRPMKPLTQPGGPAAGLFQQNYVHVRQGSNRECLAPQKAQDCWTSQRGQRLQQVKKAAHTRPFQARDTQPQSRTLSSLASIFQLVCGSSYLYEMSPAGFRMQMYFPSGRAQRSCDEGNGHGQWSGRSTHALVSEHKNLLHPESIDFSSISLPFCCCPRPA